MELSEREDELQKIKRYVLDITPIMYYRTNDLIHLKRVIGHFEQMIPQIKKVYGDKFNYDFARASAEVHDDPEIFTSLLGRDVTLYEKERMNEKEKKKLSDEEEKAIPKLVERYGLFFKGFDYEELLYSTKEKNKLETQIISFCDKFDGAGEAWHEIWAGNEFFVLPAGGKNAKSGGYIRRFKEFKEKYPSLNPFFEEFPEYLLNEFDFEKIPSGKKPHTIKSLKKDSGFPLYELWKKSVIKTEGVKNLVTQLEFY